MKNLQLSNSFFSLIPFHQTTDLHQLFFYGKRLFFKDKKRRLSRSLSKDFDRNKQSLNIDYLVKTLQQITQNHYLQKKEKGYNEYIV